MFAFGGNGPLFACGMARSLGIRRVVIPPSAGLFSSFGLLYADVEHHYSRTLRRVLGEADPDEVAGYWNALHDEADAQLQRDGFSAENRRYVRYANLHYKGQIFELTVPAPEGPVDEASLAALAEAFGAEHERTYGHRAGPDEPVELVNIVVVGQGVAERPRIPPRLILPPDAVTEEGRRDAYFGPDTGWLETPVIGRGALGTPRAGPFIVEEYDATCVVPPDSTASLDDYGNIRIELA